MCSGQHTVSLLLSRLSGWDPDRLLAAEPPVAGRLPRRSSPARSATTPRQLRTAIDGCGVETYAFPLREVARAYAMLADPAAIPAGDPRSELAAAAHDGPRRDARPTRRWSAAGTTGSTRR